MDASYWDFSNKNDTIYWKAICSKERNIAIYEIEKIANKYGYIADHHMFSDLEICIKVEVEERNISNFYIDLKKIIDLNDYENLKSETNRECSILLNISFFKKHR